MEVRRGPRGQAEGMEADDSQLYAEVLIQNIFSSSNIFTYYIPPPP